MKNIPALDGIRGLAILLVLIFHWFPSTHWINAIPNGPIGVTLFFVLSGFLITQILLVNKAKHSFLTNLKNFLARRALRIFPIYYAVLIGLFFLKKFHIEVQTDLYENPISYFLYVYNHLLESTQNWSDQLSPNWSLSVEEQFYWFWPLLILGIQKSKTIIKFILASLLLGIIFRYYFIQIQHGIGVIMLTCIDCFAWGALLAYCKIENISLEKLFKWLLLPVFVIWIYICTQTTDQDLVKILFFRTSTAFLSAALIFYSFKSDIITNIFSFAPLTQIGKISYGIYLFHMVIPDLFFIVLGKFHIILPEIIRPWISAGVLFTFAYISFNLIEKPILGLKKYFE